MKFFFKPKEEITLGPAVSSELLETAEALLGRGSLTHQQVSTGLAALSINIKSCHASQNQWEHNGRSRQASGAEGGDAPAERDARSASSSLGEDHKSGGGDRRVQDDSKSSEAPFYTILQFFSLPALVAQQVHVEGPVPIQPWRRGERRRLGGHFFCRHRHQGLRRGGDVAQGYRGDFKLELMRGKDEQL